MLRKKETFSLILISIFSLVTLDLYLVLQGHISNLRWTFAQNILLITGVWFLAFFYSTRLKYITDSSTRWLVIGIILNAIGYGIHRSWFSVMRYLENNGGAEFANFFLEHSYFTFLSIVLVTIGTAYHLREFLIYKCGNRWFWVYGLAALIVFNLGLLLG